MSDAVQVIEREIAKRKAEIEALQLALKALTGKAPTAPKPKQLALPAPQAAEHAQKNGGGTFTVNGVDLELTEGEWPVANAIADAEDCCSVDLLESLCGGKRQNVQNRVFSINQKLKPAGAHIVHFKGEGYRLQNIEDNT